MKAAPWTFTERARNIHHFSLELANARDERWFLLQSDVHWDNPMCDRAMFTKHLQQATDREAAVLDNGDFFCAMQGKWDRRANKNDLRPEHQSGDYLDALVRTAADDLAPYKQLLTVRASGNHESGVLRHHESNLTERLTQALKTKGSQTIATGGYSGFVVFNVTHNGTRRTPVKMYYHHGFGGGGPVTRGVIQTNRMAVYLDADLVFTGHTHDSWQMPIARVRLNQDNTEVVHTRQVHVRAAGYKEEFRDGYGGYHVERGGPPKPVGGVWLKIYMADSNTVDFELTEAR